MTGEPAPAADRTPLAPSRCNGLAPIASSSPFTKSAMGAVTMR